MRTAEILSVNSVYVFYAINIISGVFSGFYTIPRIFSFFLLLRPSERGFPRLPNSHARQFLVARVNSAERVGVKICIVCTVNTRQSSSCIRRCFPSSVRGASVLLLGVLYFFSWGCFPFSVWGASVLLLGGGLLFQLVAL